MLKTMAAVILSFAATFACCCCGGTVLHPTYVNYGSHVTWDGEPVIGADPKTFTSLKRTWGKDIKSAYYRQLSIPGSDPRTFKAVNTDWAHDDNRAYHGRRKPVNGWYLFANQAESVRSFELADGATFTMRRDGLPADSLRVYNKEGQPIQSLKAGQIHYANPKTFAIDKATRYAHDGQSIWYANYSGDLDPLDEVDVATWRQETRGWSRDAHRVWLDGWELHGANAARWEIVPGDYRGVWSRDDRFVWYQTRQLHNADPASFEMVDSRLARDDQRAWWNGRPLEGADPSTLAVHRIAYVTDATTTWREGQVLEGVDGGSFRLIKGDLFADQDAVYRWRRTGHEAIPDADAATFRRHPNNPDYEVDRHRLYYDGRPLKLSAEAQVEGIYAWDDVHVYAAGKSLDGAEPATFVVDGIDTARDGTGRRWEGWREVATTP